MSDVVDIAEFALTAPAPKPRRTRKLKQHDIPAEAFSVKVRVPKAPKTPKPKKDRSLRALFRAKLRELDIERLKKPWMASRSFRLIDTAEKLIEYVDKILADKSCWHQPYLPDAEGKGGSDFMPVIAVDTETHGLDTRVMVDFDLRWDYELNREICIPIYELNIEIAGVCLSHDGKSGVYIPIFHEKGDNVPIEIVHEQLQRLFDASHLVFYNAKFDREVMRQTLGINFRPYPHYEDVQVLQFSNDPKADLDDDTFTGGGEGLKGLSKTKLGMEQIELAEIGKVKAELELTPEQAEEERVRPRWVKLKAADTAVCHQCGEKATHQRIQIIKADGGETIEERFECSFPGHLTKVKYKKAGQRMQYVPFTWVPTHIALWYAAADAICTWLLWEGRTEVERNAAYRAAYGTQCINHPDGPKVCFRVKGHTGPCERALGMREEAQTRKLVHRIDGDQIDSLTWMERQRFIIDTEAHPRLVRWHEKASAERRVRLRQLANESGWQEATTDEGTVIADSIFKVDSPHDLPKLLFEMKGFTPTKFTEKGKRSCDAEAIGDLLKLHPHDEFLKALTEYKEYVSLHPEKLSWDKRDNTARIYLKQATTAGGRLAASGGKFDRDGGLNMNIQAIKSVGGNWWVKGDILKPDYLVAEDVDECDESQLHPSVFQEAKKDEIKDANGRVLSETDPDFAVNAETMGFKLREGKWTRKAPGILNNHVANYLGYSICLVPGCKSCAERHGILIANSRIDANQIINLRALFIAKPGWTMFSSDYSNIEMRVAANISGEPEFIKEFLEGSGDFHTLTASKVFPEFNDPNTSKARKKELRSLAKIINFALLYGGTQYTIYENMRKEDPTITMERTKEMVDAYWRGVPVFRMWCDMMQKTARDLMTCTTATNRIVKFEAAMAKLGITKPSSDEMNNYFAYMKLRKKFRELESLAKARSERKEETPQEEKDQAAGIKAHMDKLWLDRDSGVRNASEYNRFMSKIQRVSVNVPLQGLAGEFMRMTINRVRRWATLAKGVESVLLMHGSVHDELDYGVKNPYVPYVVPRITRLMKLRKIHANRKWRVGIEADTEYGRSWDVAFHLTGDDGHKPSGWTDIAGLENYIPHDFDPSVADKLVRALSSGKEEARAKADAWLKANLHERAYSVVWHAFWAEDKNKVRTPVTDEKVIRKQLIAALQLHEYWLIDAVPDSDDHLMETLEQYEERRGLTVADRGYMPEGGWLHAVPLDRVRRKPLPILGPDPEPPTEDGSPVVEVVAPESEAQKPGAPPYDDEAAPEVIAETVDAPPPPPPAGDTDDDIFFPSPAKKKAQVQAPVLAAPAPPQPTPVPVITTVTALVEPEPITTRPLVITKREEPVRPVIPKGLPVLRDLGGPEMLELLAAMGKNLGGELSIRVLYKGAVINMNKLRITEIPQKYLA